MGEKVITATSPCMKFIDWGLERQVDKLQEEVTEVRNALAMYRRTGDENDIINLMMEMLDVQTCVNTMFSQLRKDCCKQNKFREDVIFSKCLKEAEAQVIQKNLARGYYA